MAEGNSTRLEESGDELYEHAPCALLSTRPDGTVIRANQTFLDWIGQQPEGIVGRVRLQALLTVGSRMYYETHYAPLLQIQGFVHEIALEMRRANGSVCPVVASARQVLDAHGAVIAHRVALFDSTDRRRYERELLEERRRAEQAAKELADADRRKSDFIAMLAHELRNPLAPIRNAVEILRRTEHHNAAVEQTTATLQRQVAQMVRVVDDLLDMSRIGHDKLSIRREAVDLASVVHHAVEMSQPLLARADIAFTLALPTKAIYAEADAARLAQVIGNILNNAAKFTPRHGAVSLVLERIDQEACIRVRDTGVGIEEEKLSRVFDLFMQADVALGRGDGLGIGLTLAKNLVERHGGRITVHSQGLGHGTEFVVHLPILAEPPTSVSHSSRPAPLEGPAASRRVLVVDDNRDAAEMMAMLLGLLGHEVRLAYDGLEAVEMTLVFKPHAVVLDIGLPTLNGYEAAQRIRTQPGVQPVLVALTGWGEEEDRRRAAEAGFDVHFIKPVDHEVLAKLIAELPAGDAG
jgi:PAS domain S-box-containing protein